MNQRGFITGAALYLLIGVLLAAGAYRVHLGLRISGLEKENARLAEAVAERDAAIVSKDIVIATQASTNTAQAHAIVDLAARHAAEVRKNTVLAQDLAAERRRLAQAQITIDTALDNLRKSRETTYEADPSARAWADHRVPVAIADGLRKQWADTRHRSLDAAGRDGRAPGIR